MVVMGGGGVVLRGQILSLEMKNEGGAHVGHDPAKA